MENFCGLLLRTYKETWHHFLPQRAIPAHRKKERKWKQDGRCSSAVAQVPPQILTPEIRQQRRSCVWLLGRRCKTGEKKRISTSHLAVTSFLSVWERTLLHFSGWQQTLCREVGCFLFSVSVWQTKFPPLWLVKVFDTLLVGCCASSRPDIQSPCGHPLYIPFFCAPLVLSRKCLIYPHAILLSHFGFSH